MQNKPRVLENNAAGHFNTFKGFYCFYIICFGFVLQEIGNIAQNKVNKIEKFALKCIPLHC